MIFSAIAVSIALFAVPQGKVVTSSEFCFKAWFPTPPIEEDVGGKTAQGVIIQARRFSSDMTVMTAFKFDRHAIAAKDVPAYFDSAVGGQAKRLNGTLSNVTTTTFDNLPARTFDITWQQRGATWRSRNLICYSEGHSLIFGAIYEMTSEGSAPSAAGKAFLERVHVDQKCIRE